VFGESFENNTARKLINTNINIDRIFPSIKYSEFSDRNSPLVYTTVGKK
jgi:hypothetical protein